MSKRSRFFSSSNPFLTENNYAKSTQEPTTTTKTSEGGGSFSLDSKAEHMTVKGAINKTFLLTGILLLTAFLGAYLASMMVMWVGIIGGLVSLLVAYFRPKTAPITAPLYAAFEGLALGTISLLYANFFYEGIVFNAIMLTLLALGVMLTLYRTGVIKATKKFRAVVTTATGAIMMLYVVNIVMHMFGGGLPYLHQMHPIGIGISLLIIGVACLNLILDFDQFEKGEQMRAPIHMEWLSAMGLLVTLIWLYLEILRLLAMFSSSD